MNGVLVIDKPAGLTSHDVVQRVRRFAKQRRVGHLGTLDPLATGVLPIALGEATKLSQLLTHGRKADSGRLRLGIETNTYDREGEVTAEYAGGWPSREEVERALDVFRGRILQTPPPFSAIKRGGEAAYALSRRGETVELEPREITIYELDLRAYDPPFIDLAVECSAGTYLRSIAHDLGARHGTGAHLWELCRTRSGPFRLDQAIPLDRLDEEGEARRIPMADATALASYEVDVGVARRVSQGVQLDRNDVRGAPREGVFQLVRKGRLVALLAAEPGLPSLRTLRVFLEGTEG